MKKVLILLALLFMFVAQAFAADSCGNMKRYIESKWGGIDSVKKQIARYEDNADPEGNVYAIANYHKVNGYKMRLKVFQTLKPLLAKGNQDLCKKAQDANGAIQKYIDIARGFHSYLNMSLRKKGEEKKRFDEGTKMYQALLKLHLELAEEEVKEFEAAL